MLVTYPGTVRDAADAWHSKILQASATASAPIRLVMRAEGDESDGIIAVICAVGTEYNRIIPLFAACVAIEEDDQEISPHRTTVVAAKIAFQRLAQSNLIGGDHIHLFLHSLLDGAVFFDRGRKFVAELEFHRKTSS